MARVAPATAHSARPQTQPAPSLRRASTTSSHRQSARSSSSSSSPSASGGTVSQHQSRIPVASYRLRTPPASTAASSVAGHPSSPQQTDTHQSCASYYSLESFAGTTTPAHTSCCSSTQGTSVTHADSEPPSRRSLGSNEAIKSPVRLERRSIDAVKSPASSVASASTHTQQRLSRHGSHRRATSSSSSASVRTVRISGPVFREASTGVHPTRQVWQDQKRSSLEGLQLSPPSSSGCSATREEESALSPTLAPPPAFFGSARPRVLSTAHEAEDESELALRDESPPCPAYQSEAQLGVHASQPKVDMLPHTPKERLSPMELQSRFSHSPGPDRGLRNLGAGHEAAGTAATSRGPSRGVAQLLRKPFALVQSASRPASPAVDREASCPSPALSTSGKGHRVLRNYHLNNVKQTDSPLRADAQVGVSTASSYASHSDKQRNSRQTFGDSNSSADPHPTESKGSTGGGSLRSVLHKTSRQLRQRLGSRPPQHCQGSPPPVPRRSGDLNLPLPPKASWDAPTEASPLQHGIRPRSRPSLASLGKRPIRPLPGASRVRTVEGSDKENAAPQSVDANGDIDQPRALRWEARHRLFSLKPQLKCSHPVDGSGGGPDVGPRLPLGPRTAESANIPRESWVDMSRDVIHDGRSATNGTSVPKKSSWGFPWRFGQKWRNAKATQVASDPSQSASRRSPPRLPPLPSSSSFALQDLRMTPFLGDGAAASDPSKPKSPPQKSLLLPTIQGNSGLQGRPIAGLPRRSDEGPSSQQPVQSKSPTHALPPLPEKARTPGVRIGTMRRNVNRLSTIASPPPSLPVVTEASPSPTRSRRNTPSRKVRSPTGLARIPRPTDSLPVPPRRLSRARAISGSAALSSKPSLSSLSSRSGGTPGGELDFDRDFTKTSARSVTTIGSSILFSDVELALNRLLTEQQVKAERERALRELTRQAQKLLSPASAKSTGAKDRDAEWQDQEEHASESPAPAPATAIADDTTVYTTTMRSAEKQLAAVLVRYLRASDMSSRSIRAGNGDSQSSMLNDAADTSDLGDLTAVTEKLQQIVNQFKSTPSSTPSRRSRGQLSPKLLRTPERSRHSRHASTSASRQSQLMLTPENWRRGEARRHRRHRSSAMGSSIGHSLMSYCSTAASSSAGDLTSLLETMMDTSDGEGLEHSDHGQPDVITFAPSVQPMSPSTARKRKESESEEFSSHSLMTPLQESVLVFGQPDPGSAGSQAASGSAPSHKPSTTPLRSILRFYADTEPDWHDEEPGNGSPVSKRKAALREGVHAVTDTPVGASTRVPIRTPRSSRTDRRNGPSSPLRRTTTRLQDSATRRAMLRAGASATALPSLVAGVQASNSPARGHSPLTSPSQLPSQPHPQYEIIINQLLTSQSSAAEQAVFRNLNWAGQDENTVTNAARSSRYYFTNSFCPLPQTPALQWPLTPPLTDSASRGLGATNGNGHSHLPPAERFDSFGKSHPPSCNLTTRPLGYVVASTAPVIRTAAPQERLHARPLSLSSPTLPAAAHRIAFSPCYPPPPALVITDADVEAKFRKINLSPPTGVTPTASSEFESQSGDSAPATTSTTSSVDVADGLRQCPNVRDASERRCQAAAAPTQRQNTIPEAPSPFKSQT
ncbi:unnamed protein product [Parajaminaea phylloscopi]